jgi:hypothetical protein
MQRRRQYLRTPTMDCDGLAAQLGKERGGKSRGEGGLLIGAGAVSNWAGDHQN